MTEPVIPPPPPPPPRTCDECGAALDERQEVCVECGHAAPAPERRRLRGALPTASVAAFAVLLAASAAYGLSAGGASNVRDLGVGQSKPPGTDTVAQATPTPPPAAASPTPDTVPQATPTPPPASSSSSPAKAPKPAAKAKTPATTTPSTSPSSPSPSGGTSPPKRTSRPHHHHSTKPPRHTTKPPSWFADADQPYDAFNYGGGSKPSWAIDGKTKTAWTTTSKGTGLVVDTGQFQPYNGIGIATSTPGFAVSIYSSDNNTGSGDPSSKGWKREARASSVGKYQRVVWKGSSKTPQYLLIWIAKLPSGTSSASINEVRLLLE